MEDQEFNVKEFKLLIQSVRKLPAKQFDMGAWKRKTSCGTAFCAFGAHVAGHGKRLGLKFVGGEIEWRGQCQSSSPFPFDIAADLFGIDGAHAVHLFSLSHYSVASKSAVLARLRQYLADHSTAVVNA